MAEKYDLVIIGAGPAGYESAQKAAEKGLKTALVEKAELGGTCLNRGCIPTKVLLHTAQLYTEIRKSEAFGLAVPEVSVDMRQLATRKEEVVRQLQTGIAGLLKKKKVTVYQGTAQILEPHRVRIVCAGGEELLLETEYILAAAGSRPSRIPVPGADLPGVLDSDSILAECRMYPSLTIIGGGVIGMEFASVYSALGCRVTVIEFLDRILANMEKEISQSLKMLLKKRGVEIHTGAAVKEIAESKDGLVCRYEEKGAMQECTADAVLVATGRRPCIEGLFSEDCMQKLQLERGHICIDAYGRTGLDGVYAAGDITCGIQLAHAATAQALNAVAHMAWLRDQKNRQDGEEKDKAGVQTVAGKLCETEGNAGAAMHPSFCMEVVPACVYTDPEIASAGMTADEAKAAGIAVTVKKYPMSANGKTVLTAQERGFIKVVADEETHRILGAQLMCARATDLIGEFCTAIVNGLTLEQLGSVIRPHPTFCEGITEAVRL